MGLDALVGTVPILGNIFDLVFKANNRNALLMREYYDEGRHTGSVWPVILMVLGGFFLIFFLTIWTVIALFSWLLGG